MTLILFVPSFDSLFQAKYQEMRAKLAGTEAKSTPIPKTSELPQVQPSLNPPNVSSSVLSKENRGATAKPSFPSIHAGEGPSDITMPEPFSRKSTKSTRESRPQPPAEKMPAMQTSSNIVRDRVRSIEASLRPDKHVPRVHITVADESGRLESELPSSQHPDPHTSQDRAKLREETSAPRVQTTVVDDGSRPEPVSKSPYQPSDPPYAKMREPSIRENNLRHEAAVPNPTFVQSAKPNGHGRAHATSKTALSQPPAGSVPSRQAPPRTVRFDLPSPPDSPEPHGETSSLIDQATKTYHPSRLVADGIPFGVPVVPSSSSDSRQTSTPPSPANQKLSPQNHSPLQPSKVDDQQLIALPTANLSTRPEQPPNQPPDVPRKPGGSHQVQSDRPRFDGPLTTAPAPVLAITHSQSSHTQVDAVHSTPSQSTSRSTKDLREDSILSGILAPQGATSSAYTSHAIEPRPSRHTRSGVTTATGQEHSGGKAPKAPTTSVLPSSLQGAPSTSLQGRSTTRDTRTFRRDQPVQVAVEEGHDLPLLQPVQPKTAANESLQVNPSVLQPQPQPAEPYSIRPISQPATSVAPKVLESLSRVEVDLAAESTRDRPSPLTAAEHSRYKDTHSARQKVQYSPPLTTQLSIEESRQIIKPETVQAAPTESTEITDSPVPLPVLLRQNTGGADEPTRRREHIGESEASEPQAHRHFNVPSTVMRTISNSIPRPELAHEPVKPGRDFVDEVSRVRFELTVTELSVNLASGFATLEGGLWQSSSRPRE